MTASYRSHTTYTRLGSLVALLVLLGSCGETGPPNSVGLYTPTSPLITFRISFQTGSVDDPRGQSGLNALTALTIGQGGTRDLTYQELTETLYPWAASIGVRFDKELTTVIGRVHRDHLEPFYEIFSDLILHPRFDPQDFERNREFLTNAIVSSLRGNDDEELGKEALNASLYEGHPYGTTVRGTETGLAAIGIEDVEQFHRNRYTRDNVLIGVAGGYPDDFVERVGEDLSALPSSGTGGAAPLPAPRTLQGLDVLLVEKEAIATAISIGHPVSLTRADEDFYPLMIANSYFGEHRTFNGRLMNQMRGLRGLNYGDYSYIENFIQDGGTRFPVPNVPRRQQFFSIWIRPVPHEKAHFALRQALRELHLLVDEGISQEDFEITRDFLLNYTKLLVQTTSRRLGYVMDSRFYGTDFFVDEVQERLATLTVDDVNAAIRRHLQYDNLAIAIVTPDAHAFRQALLSTAPSPITYNTDVSDEILEEDEEISAFPLAINPDRIRVVPVEEMFR